MLIRELSNIGLRTSPVQLDKKKAIASSRRSRVTAASDSRSEGSCLATDKEKTEHH